MSIDSNGNKTARPGSSFDRPVTGIGPDPVSTAKQSTYDLMLDALSPADKARHLEADIEGHQVLCDTSGAGHHWVLADANLMPANIREEIAGEIIDGKVAECNDYVASNGQHYRWS